MRVRGISIRSSRKKWNLTRPTRTYKKVADEMNDAISKSNLLYLRAMGLAPLETKKEVKKACEEGIPCTQKSQN